MRCVSDAPSCSSTSRASRPRACCEQRVDLDAGEGADGVEEQLGLAPVVGVDRTGGEAGGAGDVLDPGALVALRHEHLDRGGDQALPGRLGGRGDGGHPAIITVIIERAGRRIGEDHGDDDPRAA